MEVFSDGKKKKQETVKPISNLIWVYKKQLRY